MSTLYTAVSPGGMTFKSEFDVPDDYARTKQEKEKVDTAGATLQKDSPAVSK